MPEYILILFRSLLAFAFLFALTRLMGKKQVSQLTLFDYIVGITIGNIAASMAVDQGIKMLNAGIGLVVWGVLPILISLVGLKSHNLRRFFDGHPRDLIRDGKILENNLRKERMNTSDLMLSLRNKNAFNLTDVEFAVLETNGQLSVMKKADAQPLTPKSFGLQVTDETDPRLVILDGKVMEKTLADLGYPKEWLLEELNKQGVSSVKEVYLAQIDSQGKLHADRYKDTNEKSQKTEQLRALSSSLTRAQSDLQQFTLSIQDPHLQQTFVQLSDQLKQSAHQLQAHMNKE